MGLPVFSCELHARVTLATMLQQADDDVVRLSNIKSLASGYRLSPEVVDSILTQERAWRKKA